MALRALRCIYNCICNLTNSYVFHRRGAPCGCPLALKRQMTLCLIRSFRATGQPQGPPLQWMALHHIRQINRIIRVFVQKEIYIDCPLSSKLPQIHPLQGRPLWVPVRAVRPNKRQSHSPLQGDRAPTRDAPASGVLVAAWIIVGIRYICFRS